MSLFNIVSLLGLALIAATCCGFAIVKGGSAERYGAAIYALAWIGVSLFEFVTGDAAPPVPILFFDFAVACGFLILAVRFNSLWLGGAMILQGIEFGLHVTRLTAIDDPRVFGLHVYALGINLVSVLILFTMVGATLTTLHERKHPKVEDDHLWETVTPPASRP
jgi:hypothetical protein